MLPGFSYLHAQSLEDAVISLSKGGARLHAGGTDLLGCLRDNVFSADTVVSISRIRELKGIEETSGGVSLGALTTLTEISESPVIRKNYPALAQGAGEAASPQIRNQGTIGGNLCQKPRCWYYRGEFLCLRKGGDRCFAVAGENQYHCIFGGHGCYIVHPSDTAPALVAYNASVRIIGKTGTRTVPVGKFFVLPSEDVTRETVLDPGEIVTGVHLPPPAAGLRSSYRKVRARQSWDFALAGVALALRITGEKITDARIVLSGAAPVPWRVPEAERELEGNSPVPDVIIRAASAAVNNARPLSNNEYKLPLFRGMIEEELTKAAR